jgi:hypothetical protein
VNRLDLDVPILYEKETTKAVAAIRGPWLPRHLVESGQQPGKFEQVVTRVELLDDRFEPARRTRPSDSNWRKTSAARTIHIVS